MINVSPDSKCNLGICAEPVYFQLLIWLIVWTLMDEAAAALKHLNRGAAPQASKHTAKCGGKRRRMSASIFIYKKASDLCSFFQIGDKKKKEKGTRLRFSPAAGISHVSVEPGDRDWKIICLFHCDELLWGQEIEVCRSGLPPSLPLTPIHIIITVKVRPSQNGEWRKRGSVNKYTGDPDSDRNK